MTITDAILAYLQVHPEGATTEQLWRYSKQMGCRFNAENEKKSVAGICSKLSDKGRLRHDNGNPNKWYRLF